MGHYPPEESAPYAKQEEYRVHQNWVGNGLSLQTQSVLLINVLLQVSIKTGEKKKVKMIIRNDSTCLYDTI